MSETNVVDYSELLAEFPWEHNTYYWIRNLSFLGEEVYRIIDVRIFNEDYRYWAGKWIPNGVYSVQSGYPNPVEQMRDWEGLKIKKVVSPFSADLNQQIRRSEDARRSLSDTVDYLQKENDELKATLRLGVKWGVESYGFSSGIASSIRKWVEAGMEGNGPKKPDYYPNNDK